MTEHRLAIIGAGGISRQHVRGINVHPRLICTAICDADAGRLAERSAELERQPARFSDWREMLERAGDEIDAVVVCLPHHLHAAAVRDAAAAGKHLLCEKPLCTNIEDADALVEAVEAAGIVFMAGHNQLFNPFVKAIKERVAAGLVGEVYYIRSQDCFQHPPTLEGSWRGRLETQGGGELIDTGYHPSYMLMHFAGSEPARVRCVMGRYRQRIEGEDTANVQILFRNGVMGEIFTSWAFARPKDTHSLHLIGSDGELFGTGNVLHHLPNGADTAERIELEEVHTFTAQLAHFADCLEGRAEPLHSVRDSRTVLSLILEAHADAAGWEQLISR